MSGQDQRGSYYPSIDAMWQNEINLKNQNNNNNKHTHIHSPNISNNTQHKQQSKLKIVNPIGSIKNWYNKANQYWSLSQATYNGVLNGYGNLSNIDITGSLNFIRNAINYKLNTNFKTKRVLDCGAGIGRIAKQMLCSIFQTVDVIDQCQKYIEKSKQILKDQNIGHFYTKGLQQFQFQQKYDCIWIQWVLSHLTDQDAIKFLKNAKNNLNQNGMIIVKQNHSQQGFLVDKDDCSVARSTQLYKAIFQKADLKVVMQEVQKDWPKDLLDVKMYLLE